MNYSVLPTINAFLNSTTVILLLCGYIAIKNKNIPWHRLLMACALVCSACFLASYLTYHYHIGSKKFEGVGLVRTIYFSILISHTFLAMVLLPMVLTTVFYAWKGRVESHKKIAKVTLPVWLYVSVTGVIVYAFLYL